MLGLAAQPAWTHPLPTIAVFGILAALWAVRMGAGERAKALEYVGAVALAALGLSGEPRLWQAAAALAVATLALRGDGDLRIGDVRIKKVDAFHYVFAFGIYLTCKGVGR